jgi:hypothetical protein
MTRLTLVAVLAVIIRVTLSWNDPNTAPDQSEDGTAIYREIAGSFQQVGSVGPNVTTFVETFSAVGGSQQCYVARPFRNDGELADAPNEWCGTVPPDPCVTKGNSKNCK